MEYDEDLGAILQKLNRKNRFDFIGPSTTLSLEEICDKMNGTLQLKKRSKGLKKYPDCFNGEDAINWMISNEIIDTREKGVEIGSLMIYSGFVTNIQGLEFEDSGDMFYTFHKDAFMFSGAQSSKKEEIHDEYLISTENIKKILERSGDENIFEESKEEITYNEEKEIIGMSLVKMIQYLTENDQFDQDLERELVITFDLFISQKDFLSLLQSRYCCIEPSNLNEEKKLEWKKEKTPLIQQRVLSILKRWISYQSQDNLENDCWFMKSVQSFMNRISRKKKRISEGSFMNAISVSNINIKSISGSSGDIFHSESSSDNENIITDPHAKLVQDILGSFNKDQKKSYTIPNDLPKFLKPKNMPIKTVTDIPCLELARQFTMIGFHIYKNVRMQELLNKRWQNEKLKNELSPNATQFIRYFNYLSLWVSTIILSEKKFKTRASLIEYFIQVASSCKEINNFCGVIQIISGLRVTAVRRLKKSWKVVSSSHMQTWEDLQSIVSTDQNYNNLRTILKDSKPPTLPHFGLFLSDMFFIVDGNNDFLSENPHIINLKKIKMVSTIIDKILSFQTVDYKFVHSSIIQRFIFDVQVKDEAQLENLSLFLEPKI